jgi:hypothetical protein
VLHIQLRLVFMLSKIGAEAVLAIKSSEKNLT